jgi:hypothetical protein
MLIGVTLLSAAFSELLAEDADPACGSILGYLKLKILEGDKDDMEEDT